MKVLHLFNEIKHSGAELMYVNAATLFRENGIEILAFSTGKGVGDFAQAFINNGIKVEHWPIEERKIPTFRSIYSYWPFYKFLKKEKIDVLHIHRSDLYFVAVLSRLAGVRTIKTMHSVFKNRKVTYLYAVMIRFFSRHLLNVAFQTISESVYDNELNYYHNHSIRINNWYDETKFFPARGINEKKVIKEKIGIKENAFVIISVGGCSIIKNHSDIIRAISLLPDKINFIYLHLGTGTEEEKEKRIAEELGVFDRIRFLDNQSNVRDFLVAADVFVMPSKSEGLGNACLEAMACGLPSILYNSPGLRDLINNDDNGFLIDPDHHLIAEKIIQLHNNPRLAEEKGKAALYHARENYSLNKNVNKIIRLYKSL